MPSMNAGMLDHRNIGSHVTLTDADGDCVSGAIALVIQKQSTTEIHLAHDSDGGFEVDKHADIELSLPPGAAYLLGLKNTVEEYLARDRT